MAVPLENLPTPDLRKIRERLAVISSCQEDRASLVRHLPELYGLLEQIDPLHTRSYECMLTYLEIVNVILIYATELDLTIHNFGAVLATGSPGKNAFDMVIINPINSDVAYPVSLAGTDLVMLPQLTKAYVTLVERPELFTSSIGYRRLKKLLYKLSEVYECITILEGKFMSELSGGQQLVQYHWLASGRVLVRMLEELYNPAMSLDDEDIVKFLSEFEECSEIVRRYLYFTEEMYESDIHEMGDVLVKKLITLCEGVEGAIVTSPRAELTHNAVLSSIVEFYRCFGECMAYGNTGIWFDWIRDVAENVLPFLRLPETKYVRMQISRLLGFAYYYMEDYAMAREILRPLLKDYSEANVLQFSQIIADIQNILHSIDDVIGPE